jgi:hypothetical protein
MGFTHGQPWQERDEKRETQEYDERVLRNGYPGRRMIVSGYNFPLEGTLRAKSDRKSDLHSETHPVREVGENVRFKYTNPDG